MRAGPPNTSAFAGVDPTDHRASAAGLPAIDEVDMIHDSMLPLRGVEARKQLADLMKGGLSQDPFGPPNHTGSVFGDFFGKTAEPFHSFHCFHFLSVASRRMEYFPRS